MELDKQSPAPLAGGNRAEKIRSFDLSNLSPIVTQAVDWLRFTAIAEAANSLVALAIGLHGAALLQDEIAIEARLRGLRAVVLFAIERFKEGNNA